MSDINIDLSEASDLKQTNMKYFKNPNVDQNKDA